MTDDPADREYRRLLGVRASRTLQGTSGTAPPTKRSPPLAAAVIPPSDLVHSRGLGADTPQTVPVLTRLSDVQPEAVRWLWSGRIPFGKLTAIEGDPGLGKSTVLLDLAARLSVGSPTGDGKPLEPAGTVLLTAEDGLADTVRPRLDAAGGDASRIVAVSAVRDGSATDPLELPRHIGALRAAIGEVGAGLLIVDPLVAYIAAGIDTHRDHDIRRALRPLAELAAETNIAVVFVRHLNKGLGPALYRGVGSIGIVGAVRSALLVARDPDDEARRVVAVVKANLAPDPGSLAFYVEADRIGSARIRWAGASPHGANVLAASSADPRARSQTADAVEWLRDELADGPRSAAETQKLARAAGLSDRAVRCAREKLGIRPRKTGFGPGGPWVWSLPIAIDAIDVQAANVGINGSHGNFMASMGDPTDPDEAARAAMREGA